MPFHQTVLSPTIFWDNNVTGVVSRARLKLPRARIHYALLKRERTPCEFLLAFWFFALCRFSASSLPLLCLNAIASLLHLCHFSASALPRHCLVSSSFLPRLCLCFTSSLPSFFICSASLLTLRFLDFTSTLPRPRTHQLQRLYFNIDSVKSLQIFQFWFTTDQTIYRTVPQIEGRWVPKRVGGWRKIRTSA